MRTGLADLQNTFTNALLDVNLASEALETFKGDPELNRDRFAFYRGNITAIWQQSCASAFPVLRQLVGADFFDDLCKAYGHMYPSQSGNLNEFGASMAEFIGTLDNCRAFPYLSDVAKLEWQVHRVYYAKHRKAVTLAEFAAVPMTNLGDLICVLQPCSALLNSTWPIHAIWHAHQTEQPTLPAELAAPSSCLVWRLPWTSGWKVQVRELSPASYQALNALQRGETLGDAVEQAFTIDSNFAFQNELAEWLNMQLIISISTHQQSI